MKKPKPQPITSSRYKVGEEFLYHNFKNVMDRVKIQEIIPGGYRLSNGITMNDSLHRVDIDAKKFPHQILPWTSEAESIFEAYNAHIHLHRQLVELQRELSQMDPFNLPEDKRERVIRINKKLLKHLKK